MNSIIIRSENESAIFLSEFLHKELHDTNDLTLIIEKTRSAEETVLVAIVAALGSGLGALISGLLKVISQKETRSIIIQGSSGRKIEIPANTSPERLKELVQIAKELDISHIIL